VGEIVFNPWFNTCSMGYKGKGERELVEGVGGENMERGSKDIGIINC